MVKKTKLNNRIHRLSGQLKKIERSIGEELMCEELVTQLLAARGAMNSLVKNYLETALEECAKSKDKVKQRQLIKLLVKHF